MVRHRLRILVLNFNYSEIYQKESQVKPMLELGVGELGGNFGTGVRASFFKPTPITHLVFEKKALFIYTMCLIEPNVYIFIYCSLISTYPLCCL